mgnify:FL=1
MVIYILNYLKWLLIKFNDILMFCHNKLDNMTFIIYYNYCVMVKIALKIDFHDDLQSLICINIFW